MIHFSRQALQRDCVRSSRYEGEVRKELEQARSREIRSRLDSANIPSSGNPFEDILDNLPQGAWSTGPDGQYDYYNRRWYEFTGAPTGAAKGEGWQDFIHPDDRERICRLWQEAIATGAPYEAEYRLRAASGEYFWTLGRARPSRDAEGKIVRWYGTCSLIQERVLAQQALDASEALNRSIVEATPDSIKLLNAAGEVLFVNYAGARASGETSPEALLGTSWVAHQPPRLRATAEHAFKSARSGACGRFTEAQKAADGSKRWWDVIVTPVHQGSGTADRVVVISRDITHQKQAEERLRWTAHHDSLTELPNRAFFQQFLDSAIGGVGSSEDKFALLLIDVDDFKRINDTLGHDAGDALLCSFAEKLKTAARKGDLVARLGGDEFAVILAGVETEEQIDAAVSKILERLREPCVYGSRILDCNASIGASLYPEQASSRAELLKLADIALYAAKASGRGTHRLFRPSMRSEMQKRLSMLSLARSALAEDRIVPFYQPKVDFGTGRISGFEALLRWRHPSRGIQTPGTISAAFLDPVLAAEISDRMIERVVADMRQWIDKGVDFKNVAINAAAAEFRRGDFAERLLETLAAAEIPPQCMELEVTETVFLGRGANYVERALKTLSANGVRIALDDFGTGYASLSHLKQFPVDILKIDKSFMKDLHDETEDTAIVRAVINLANNLKIKVVAEGVETQSQADYLWQNGCNFGQGYLFGKAAPAARVPHITRRQRLFRAQATQANQGFCH
jgi:diguanylate cyclase (GGDEF)-like protein/PAS domain S-box-containing protein